MDKEMRNIKSAKHSSTIQEEGNDRNLAQSTQSRTTSRMSKSISMTDISDSSIFLLSHALLRLRGNEHTLSLDEQIPWEQRGKGQEYSKPEWEGQGWLQFQNNCCLPWRPHAKRQLG